MTDLLPIRFGENSQLATPAFDDLWLLMFGGEVQVRFDENIVLLPLVELMTITQGTTFEFPRLNQGEAERHAAGAEMLGLDIEMGAITISIDSRPIVHHQVLDDIDLMMSHFEIRSKLATESGRAIARAVDRNVARLLLNTSRTAAPAFGPFPGGGIDQAGGAIVDATLAADAVPSSATSRAAAGALIQALDRASVVFEEQDYPDTDRTCIIRPREWHALRVFGIPITEAEMYGSGATAGPFWQQPGLGEQSPMTGLMPRGATLTYNGISIVRSPNIGNENVTSGPTKYQGDFSNSLGVIFHKSSMAYLQMMGMKTEAERSTRHLADFVVSSHLGGGGALRPDGCFELASA